MPISLQSALSAVCSIHVPDRCCAKQNVPLLKVFSLLPTRKYKLAQIRNAEALGPQRSYLSTFSAGGWTQSVRSRTTTISKPSAIISVRFSRGGLFLLQPLDLLAIAAFIVY